MAKQTFTTGQVLTAAQMTSLQQTAMLGGDTTAKTTSYTLVAADAGTTVAMSNAGSTTITVNTSLFAAGDIVTIQNRGAGVCTITAGTATVNTSGSLVLAQYQGGVLYFTSTSAAIFFQFATPESGDITGVTAGTGLSGGGTSGAVTVTNSMATAIDAKGDLVVGTGADTFSRLAVGTNTYVLTADSAEATGLKWATAAPDISCRVYAGTATNLSSTFATIAFNTENFDTDTMHDNSTNNSRITIKTAGKYHVGGQVNTSANQALGLRLFVNGGSVIGRIFQGNSGATEGANINTIYDFAVNDYIELQAALGASTGTTTTDQQTNFWAYKI